MFILKPSIVSNFEVVVDEFEYLFLLFNIHIYFWTFSQQIWYLKLLQI